MPRTKGQKNITPANETLATAAATVNDAFSPGADWRSIKGAAEYLGFVSADDDATKHNRAAARIRNAIKTAPAFGKAGAIKAIGIEGYDIPPIVYIHVNALDEYRGSLVSTNGSAPRGPHRDTKRWVIDVPHDKRDALFAELAERWQIAPREASSPRKIKADANGATDGAAPVGSDTPFVNEGADDVFGEELVGADAAE